MTDSLAQSLVDVAAEAMAGNQQEDPELWGWSGLGLSEDASRAAIAVLEKLADLTPGPGPLPAKLRELAREIGEGR